MSTKKKKGGLMSGLFGIIGSLIMLGVVLAILKVSGVNSIEETVKLAKEKSAEYSECMPDNSCGLGKVVEELVNDTEIIKLPTGNPNTSNELKEFSVSDEEGYKGPSAGEPYVTSIGSVKKEATTVMLKDIKVVKDDSKDVGYSRKEWKHWTPYLENNCWNTREEVLLRDSVPGSIKLLDKKKGQTEGKKTACAVGKVKVSDGITKIETNGSGSWIDPYSGKKITDSGEIDIDHIIPLSKAARSGGQSWTKEQKETYANDLDNLLAVSAKENRSKSDKGPGEYMPSSKKYHCQYAKSYIAIAYKYKLTINTKDSEVLTKTLKECDI